MKPGTCYPASAIKVLALQVSYMERGVMKGKLLFAQAMPSMDSLRGHRAFLLSVLLMLEGLALGGCITSLMMRNLVSRMMGVYRDPAQVLAVYNLLDHLIPYYFCYGGALLVLTVATASVWFVTRSPKPANV